MSEQFVGRLPRTKGQSHASSAAPTKDQVNEDFDNYLLQQQPPQNMRQSWSGGYNTAATIPSQPGGDQQQQPPQQQQQQPPQQQQQAAYMSYYPPNAAPMSYPFMNPSGPTLSDGAWSNGTADPTINFLGGYGQMGADYMNSGNAMFGGFSGYQPGFSWEFPGGAGDYNAWGAPPTGTAQAPGGPAPAGLAQTGPPAPGGSTTRKDDRMLSHPYHATSSGEYYIPAPATEHHGAVGYVAAPGTLNGSEIDRDIKAIDHSLKDVHISQSVSGGGIGLDPSKSASSVVPSAAIDSQQSTQLINTHQHNNNTGNQGSSSSSSASKKSWASIASAPAKQQLSLRPKTIPRAPVLPGSKAHGPAQVVGSGLDIGTWDNSVKRDVPIATKSVAGQPLPTKPTWNAGGVGRGSAQTAIGRSGTAGNTYSTSVIGSNSSAGGNQVSSAGESGSNTGGIVGQTMANSNVQNSTEQQSAGGSNYQMRGGNNNGMAANGAVDVNNPVLDRLRTANQYNPRDTSAINAKNARFFIIKSYSEDDIHRSIKYSIWCSTEHGNKRLDAAYRERENKGPVYLFFSVNGSGHFCGMTQMMSALDYSASSGVWAQDKWKGQFEVKWIYVKDVPNSQLRHIRLENNENKPVTNSRDTQEVPPEKGRQVLKIINSYRHTTSIFDDFSHYEKRQEEDHTVPSGGSGGSGGGGHHGGDRGHYGGDRGGHHDGGRGGGGHHGGSDRGHDRRHGGGDRGGDHGGNMDGGRKDQYRPRHNNYNNNKDQHHQ